MKKLALILGFLLVCSVGHASILTFDQVTSDAGFSYASFNNPLVTIYDDYNGGIDSQNIEDDSLTESDFADAINPRVRDFEFLGDFTYTGMLPPTSASLTSVTTAGTSYVNGYRIVKDSTSKTYTASKDTWVYIDQNSTYQYEEVALGAAEPSAPANSLKLAKVRTDATTVASVSDERVTAPPGLRVYEDYRMGLTMSYDSAIQFLVTKGEIESGSAGKKRRNTVDKVVGWGDADSGISEAASTYYYVWSYPTATDTSTISYVITTSSSDSSKTDDRLVGWFWNDESSNISADAIGGYKGDGSGVPNFVYRMGTTDISNASATDILMEDMQMKFFSSGRPCNITFTAPIRDGDGETYMSISLDSAAIGVTATGVSATAGLDNAAYMSYPVLLAPGIHNVEVKWRTSGNACTQKGASVGPRILTIEEK